MEKIKSTKLAESFMDETLKEIKNYQSEVKKINDGLREKRLTASYVETSKKKLRDEISNKVGTLRERLLKEMEQEEENLKKIVLSKQQQLTADDAVLLNTIDGMSTISEQDLNEYVETYKNNPLALKKIYEIAQNHNLFVKESSYKPSEKIERLYGNLKYNIEHFSKGAMELNSNTDSLIVVLEQTLSMVKEGTNGITKTLSEEINSELGLKNPVKQNKDIPIADPTNKEETLRSRLKEVVSELYTKK